jgi:hypothetical protein
MRHLPSVLNATYTLPRRSADLFWKYSGLLALTFGLLCLPVSAQDQNDKDTVRFSGMCDASGALWVGDQLLIVNDEDKPTTWLRFFDPAKPGPAVRSLELSTKGLRVDPENKDLEIDLEAITQMGDRYWLIGSHSRNTHAELQETRHNLISLSLTPSGVTDVHAITTLAAAIGAEVQRVEPKFQIDPALDPKEGGLSIEGLAATSDGSLLIGLRSPLNSKDEAIVVRLSHPESALASNRPGENIDKAFFLPLDGLGVRDLIFDAKTKSYLILSGPKGEGGPFQIWKWTGDDSTPAKFGKPIPSIPENTAAEGLVRTRDGKAFWIVLDEGANLVGSKECKKAKPEKRSFRMMRIDLPMN